MKIIFIVLSLMKSSYQTLLYNHTPLSQCQEVKYNWKMSKIIELIIVSEYKRLTSISLKRPKVRV